MSYNATLNDHRKVCKSCTIYIVSFVIFFIISIRICSGFIYFHCYLIRSNTYTNVNTKTVIY